MHQFGCWGSLESDDCGASMTLAGCLERQQGHENLLRRWNLFLRAQNGGNFIEGPDCNLNRNIGTRIQGQSPHACSLVPEAAHPTSSPQEQQISPQTVEPKVGHICILGAFGLYRHTGLQAINDTHFRYGPAYKNSTCIMPFELRSISLVS